MRKFFKLIHEIILGICIVVLLIAGLIAFGTKFSIPGGYSIFSVLTGSMEPSVPVGALIVTKIPRSNDDIQQGNIITFNEPGYNNKYVTHRVYNVIQQGSVRLYQTKGDANNSPDPWRIAYGSIKGVYQIEFPYLGFFLEFIKSPVGISIFVLIPVVLIFFSELMKLFNMLFQAKIEKARESGSHTYSLIIPIIVVLALMSWGGSKTFALFTSQPVQIQGNEIITAIPSLSPSPTETPTPTPSATPTPSPSSSPCGGDVNISGNGAESDNSVNENCSSNTTVSQNNNDNVQNNITTSSDTGGNSTSDNTSSSNSTTSGSSSTTMTVTTQTGSNQ